MAHEEYCDDDACYNSKPCLLHIPPPPAYSMDDENQVFENEVSFSLQPPPYDEELPDTRSQQQSKFIFPHLEEKNYNSRFIFPIYNSRQDTLKISSKICVHGHQVTIPCLKCQHIRKNTIKIPAMSKERLLLEKKFYLKTMRNWSYLI